jgi:hypothetical protein
LDLHLRIEDWHGAPDPDHLGTGGPAFVEPAPDPNPLAPATVAAARSAGIPTFEHQNGRMMDGLGLASISDVRARDGIRQLVGIRTLSLPSGGYGTGRRAGNGAFDEDGRDGGGGVVRVGVQGSGSSRRAIEEQG